MYQPTDYETTATREQLRQLTSDQECLDHEQSILDSLVDRNGLGAVKHWLAAYEEELTRQERDRAKRFSDPCFRWSEYDEF